MALHISMTTVEAATQPFRNPPATKPFRCPFKLVLVPREAMAEGASYAYRMQTVFLVECPRETVFEGALGDNRPGREHARGRRR